MGKNPEQLTLFGGYEPKPNPLRPVDEYDAFVEKFNPKKTTDDCYTPKEVYGVVLDFVRTLTDTTGREIVRPFWPGGDYEVYPYPDRCIVVDNPPFSIYSKIVRFYLAHGIDFFLFGPSLTLIVHNAPCTFIISNSDITYENGAVVRTGFVTSLTPGIRLWCCPQLGKSIKEAQKAVKVTKKVTAYTLPDNVATCARLQYIASHNTELVIKAEDCASIRDLDGMKVIGKSLFGGGFLLSEKAAAEKAAAEKAAAVKVTLSPRERRIVEELGKHG